MNLQPQAAQLTKLRPHDKGAVKFTNHLLESLEPMVKAVDVLDVSTMKIGGDQTGKLKSVAVSMPTFLDWDTGISVGEIENIGNKPDRLKAVKEHLELVKTLVAEGVDVTIIKPDPALLEGVYTRDLGFVIGDKFIQSNFVMPIRQKEEKTIKGGIKPPPEVKLEGGNVSPTYDEFVFVGIGDRTNIEAAIWLQETVGTDFKVVPVALKEGVLHLDCAFSPIARPNGTPGGALAYVPAFAKESDVDFIRKVYGRIFEVSNKEYKALGPNTFSTGPKTTMANVHCPEVCRILEQELHHRVIKVALEEATKGEGFVRCSTLPLAWD